MSRDPRGRRAAGRPAVQAVHAPARPASGCGGPTGRWMQHSPRRAGLDWGGQRSLAAVAAARCPRGGARQARPHQIGAGGRALCGACATVPPHRRAAVLLPTLLPERRPAARARASGAADARLSVAPCPPPRPSAPSSSSSVITHPRPPALLLSSCSRAAPLLPCRPLLCPAFFLHRSHLPPPLPPPPPLHPPPLPSASHCFPRARPRGFPTPWPFRPSAGLSSPPASRPPLPAPPPAPGPHSAWGTGTGRVRRQRPPSRRACRYAGTAPAVPSVCCAS